MPGAPLRVLWLTRAFPEPANSGEFLYSGGLIRSLAKTGAQISVIAHSRANTDPTSLPENNDLNRGIDRDGVKWNLVAPIQGGGRIWSLISQLPSDSRRLAKGGAAQALRRQLRRGAEATWDVAVIDQAANGWAVPMLVAARTKGRIRAIAYLSHNAEAQIRPQIAAAYEGPLPLRQAMRWDAAKYAKLERAICQASDLIGSITAEDASSFRVVFPGKAEAVLPPGWATPPEFQPISGDRPRRVILVGSFEWIAKRMNLERLLAAAEPILRQAGIEIQIAGKADPQFVSRLTHRFPALRFAANVEEVGPFLRKARVGLMPDELGGGFKLKSLDYIFHGIPIASLRPAAAGLPLRSGDHYLAADSFEDLAGQIVGAIDNTGRLNGMAGSAHEICLQHFRWESTGAKLDSALRRVAEFAEADRKARAAEAKGRGTPVSGDKPPLPVTALHRGNPL